MNAPEKQILRMALVFLVLGLVFRYLPWGVPAIGQVDTYSNLEYVAERDYISKKSGPGFSGVTNKVAVVDSSEHKAKKRKNAKNKQKKPNLPIHVNSAGVEELCALKGACRENFGVSRPKRPLFRPSGFGKSARKRQEKTGRPPTGGDF